LSCEYRTVCVDDRALLVFLFFLPVHTNRTYLINDQVQELHHVLIDKMSHGGQQLIDKNVPACWDIMTDHVEGKRSRGEKKEAYIGPT